MKVKVFSEIGFGGLSFYFYEEVGGRQRVVEPIKMALKEFGEFDPIEVAPVVWAIFLFL